MSCKDLFTPRALPRERTLGLAGRDDNVKPRRDPRVGGTRAVGCPRPEVGDPGIPTRKAQAREGQTVRDRAAWGQQGLGQSQPLRSRSIAWGHPTAPQSRKARVRPGSAAPAPPSSPPLLAAAAPLGTRSRAAPRGGRRREGPRSPPPAASTALSQGDSPPPPPPPRLPPGHRQPSWRRADAEPLPRGRSGLGTRQALAPPSPRPQP